MDAPIPGYFMRTSFGWRRRIEPILQAQSSECGLACLAMISQYLGASQDMRALRLRSGSNARGMNGADMVEAARQMSLNCIAVRANVDELRSLRLPAILHVDMNHCVVLTGISKRGATVVDPAFGERSFSNTELSTRFTGVAFLVSPGDGFAASKKVPSFRFGDLMGSAEGLPGAIAYIVVLAAAAELLSLAAPLLMQTIVDKVLPRGDGQLVLIVGGVFVLLLALQAIFSAARSWAVVCLGQQLSFGWTHRIYSHLLRLPDSYFSTRHLGDIVSRFDSVSAMQRTLTTRVAEVLLDSALGILTLVVMLVYSKKLTAVALVFVAGYAALRAVSFRALNRVNVSEIAATARQQSVFLEAVRGVSAIRLFNAQSFHTSRYMARMAKTLESRAVLESIHLFYGTLNTMLFGVLRVALLVAGATMATGGAFTIGMLVAFVAYADRFASKAGSLIDFVVDIRMMRMHGERIADITGESIEKDVDGDEEHPDLELSIEFDNVSFRYSSKDRWILRNCSWRLDPGSSACIIGASGTGKSTVAKLILGALEPTEGAIRIGGVDVRRLGKRRLRELAAAAMQDGPLMSGSIAENITFFDDHPCDERIADCANRAQIDRDIAEMPMRFETIIGDMGTALSGGQRQRLLIARALYRQPSILLLDEATSHLDPSTEARILAAVSKMPITRLSIAHRAESVRLAERVFELREGLLADVTESWEMAHSGGLRAITRPKSLLTGDTQ